MGRVILLSLLVATTISKDIFEPADLDRIFKFEGKDGASEKKDELQKANPESKDMSKDKQYIGFQYSNESTTTCFINPQTSEKREQKAQLSYVISLSSLLSKASSAPTSTSTEMSSAPASDKSSSVLSSLGSASVLEGASSAKSKASASIYKTKEQSEKTKMSFQASSMFTSVTSKDEKKPVSAHIMAAAGKHREEASPTTHKEKQEKKEPGKGKYWTTVMAYGTPEKVLIGVKTITIIESIIREPAISRAAASIAKTAFGEQGDVRSSETMKVGDIVLPHPSTGGPQHQDVGNIAKSTSEASIRSSRPEVAAEMPSQAKKEMSAATGVEKKTPRTMSGVISQSSSFYTKHTASASVDSAIEKLTIATSVQKKDTGNAEAVSDVSKSALSASQPTRENKQSNKGGREETKTAHSTRHGREEQAKATKTTENVFSSGPASSYASSKSTSRSSETEFAGKDKNISATSKSSITVVMLKHQETRSSLPAVLSSATSGLNMSSIQHRLSQINEKVQKSLSSSLASVASAKKEESEHKKAAASMNESSVRLSVPTSGQAFSKKVSGIESRTQKHTGAKGKAAESSTTISTATKKRKEGFGGLGIWKRIGNFSNDGEESSKDIAERSDHVSSSVVKNVGEKKEGDAESSRKNGSIVDILTVLNDVSKKKGDSTKIFIDGDFQAKKNNKKISSKLKFKGWISNSSNE